MMDWGNAEDFIKFGEVGSDQIENDCSYYILIAPQNIVGGAIVTKLEEMAILIIKLLIICYYYKKGIKSGRRKENSNFNKSNIERCTVIWRCHGHQRQKRKNGICVVFCDGISF